MDDVTQGAAAGAQAAGVFEAAAQRAARGNVENPGREAVRVLEVVLGMNATRAGDAAAASNVFATPDGLSSAEVAAALHEALRALHERERARERRERLPANVGKPWTPAQDAELLAAFDAGLPLDEIAARLQRTRVGVRTRLERHGRLAPPSTAADPDAR